MGGWIIFFGVFMLAITIVTFVTVPGPENWIIGGIPVLVTLFILLSLIGTLTGGQAGSLVAWDCPQGLVYQLNGKLNTIYWNDISTVWRKTGLFNGVMSTLAYVVQPSTAPQFAFSLLSGPFAKMTLAENSGGSTTVSIGGGEFTQNGGFFQISGDFTLTEYAGLGELIEERMLEYKLPQALEAYRAGSPIAFGNLMVRQQGLADSTRELAWADIDRMQISVNAIQITKKPTSMVWFNLSAASTPNLALLAALLNTIHEGKA